MKKENVIDECKKRIKEHPIVLKGMFVDMGSWFAGYNACLNDIYKILDEYKEE